MITIVLIQAFSDVQSALSRVKLIMTDKSSYTMIDKCQNVSSSKVAHSQICTCKDILTQGYITHRDMCLIKGTIFASVGISFWVQT